MHPMLERVAEAYRPLGGRNRLVEGPALLPRAGRQPPRRRMALLALVAALCGRRR
jgi:hypothetical protein